jgi:hypothetical protein
MDFRALKEFPGYEINKAGLIRNRVSHRELSPWVEWTGYVRVALGASRAVQKIRFVHRLLAEAFIPNPHGYPCVNHLNGKKADNRLENLEWCSYSMNMQHAFDTGLKSVPGGEKHHSARLTENQAREIIHLLKERELSQTQIGRLYGVSRGCVLAIWRHESWKGLPR